MQPANVDYAPAGRFPSKGSHQAQHPTLLVLTAVKP